MAVTGGEQRKKVDATIDLIVQDRGIARDYKILHSLGRLVRSRASKPRAGSPQKNRPSLYKQYRGYGFPLLSADSARLRPWSKLTPWMKTQIASLCLHSTTHRVFTITLHEQLAEELRARGADPKAYLRDRMARCLRDALGCVPWFQFVIEDRSKSGFEIVKTHAHGVIQILPIEPRHLKGGGYSRPTRMKIAKAGIEAVRLVAGEKATLEVLKLASGNGGGRPDEHHGRSQVRNLWWRRSYHPIFNVEWVSYSWKNAAAHSASLPDNRLAMCRPLNQEAQRLWDLIRLGERAIDAWPIS